MDKLNPHAHFKELSDEEILKHKNFEALLNAYHQAKKTSHRITWFIGTVSAAAAAAIALLIYFSFFRNTENEIRHHTEKIPALVSESLQKNISPPLASVTVPAEKFTLDAHRGGNIINKNGSRIKIPAKAFIDKNGQEVQGKIELQYREFHNPVDVFLSGIPMHFDSAGQTYFMQTAGMMEILAYQNQEPLALKENSRIEVEMISFFPGDYFLYYFDNKLNQWINKGKSDITEIRKTAPAPAIADKNPPPIPEDSTVIPVKPRKADSKKSQFNINVDISKFPELAEYKQVSFEVNEKYYPFDKNIFNVRWEKASLQKSDEPDNYLLTLSSRDSSVTLLVYPVFGNKTYDKALAIYNEKQKQYKAILEKQKTKTPSKETHIAPQDYADNTQEAIQYAKLKPKGKRLIEVDKLGIYNCNLPVSMASAQNLSPAFTDPAGKPIKNPKIYLAEQNRNLLLDWGKVSDIRYFKEKTYVLWIVTQEGEIGVLAPETFAALANKKDKTVFECKLSDAETGIETIKNYLSI